MPRFFGSIFIFVMALALPAFSASAQSVGMQVVDSAGASVGTVTAIQGDNLLIKTDKHDALLPKTSFTLANGKLLFAMTQAQLDSKIEEVAAASQKSIAVGAVVNGSAGSRVGKIDSVEGGNVTITLDSGRRIQVPSNGLRGNSDGTVTIGYSAQQLDALVPNDSGASKTGS